MNKKSPKLVSERRIVMSHQVARRWLQKHARAEYRLSIYSGASNKIKGLPNLLRSFRDQKIRLGSKGNFVTPIPDLGIKDRMDSIQVWSSDHSALITLKNWLEDRGAETSGIW